MTANHAGDQLDRASNWFRDRLPVVFAVFACFMIFSAVRSPVPSINEPHYLTKAKHYWNPDFCRGDFYLNSADAHVVFFQTVGALTQRLTLEQTAWTARIIALSLLAFGWCSLVSRLLPGRWSSLWVACLYLTITAIGQASKLAYFGGKPLQVFDLSGEWIVGGIEGKVFAYAFVFWGMAFLLDGRWSRAAICCGLAISIHPVVGLWSVVAAAFSSLVTSLRQRDRNSPRSPPQLARLALAALLLFVAAAPGFLPALKFVAGGDPIENRNAAFIQVYYRLQHHLDPMVFPWTAYGSYLFLGAVWLIGRRRADLRYQEAWFAWFVAGSVLILSAGFLIGLRSGPPHEMMFWELRTKLLKFYPFRLADVMIPIAVSVVGVGLMRQVGGKMNANEPKSGRQFLGGPVLLLCLIAALFLPSLGRNPSRLSREQLADWKAACRWIATETPADAMFLIPTDGWGFKWYAQRAEFVSFKDCPQDAAGLVEWNQRMRLLTDWSAETPTFSGGFSVESVHQLREQSQQYEEQGITHILALAGRLGPFQSMQPIYENPNCQIYRLSDIPPGRTRQSETP